MRSEPLFYGVNMELPQRFSPKFGGYLPNKVTSGREASNEARPEDLVTRIWQSSIFTDGNIELMIRVEGTVS